MDKHQRYNRSEKGKARYARYRRNRWLRVETARLAWNRTRRERRLGDSVRTQD